MAATRQELLDTAAEVATEVATSDKLLASERLAAVDRLITIALNTSRPDQPDVGMTIQG